MERWRRGVDIDSENKSRYVLSHEWSWLKMCESRNSMFESCSISGPRHYQKPYTCESDKQAEVGLELQLGG